MTKTYKLALAFGLCYFYMLFLPSASPHAKLLFFAPFLIVLFSNTSFPVAIWLASGSGLILDLYATGTPLGFIALNYLLSTLLLYRFHIYFLEEKTHIFAFYGILLSFCSTCLHFILYALIDMRLKIHFFTLLTDLIVMPLFDGIYSLIFVLYPLALISYLLCPKNIYHYRRWQKRVIRQCKFTLKKLRFPL